MWKVHCSLPGHGSLKTKGIQWECGTYTFPWVTWRAAWIQKQEPWSPTAPNSSLPNLVAVPWKSAPIGVMAVCPGQGIEAQTSRQQRHPEVHPTWLNFKAPVAVWNKCSRVKDWGWANPGKTNSLILQSVIPFPFSLLGRATKMHALLKGRFYFETGSWNEKPEVWWWPCSLFIFSLCQFNQL